MCVFAADYFAVPTPSQMDLDNNSTLQAVLKQRRMLMDSLRSAMTIQSGSKGGGGKGVAGSICFAWGAGSNGQLGQPVINGQLRSVNTPTEVMFDKLENSIVRVSSGNGHVSCVTDAGEVWGWGDGRSGQLVRGAEPRLHLCIACSRSALPPLPPL
eukprot:COSAG02_NODE_1966_length_10235_cov_3.563635_5_plen_156_part_00